MLSRRAQALLILNVSLIALLGALTLWPAPLVDASAALAQSTPPGTAAAARPRGQYIMVSGRVQGSTANVVYILDSANQEMIGVRYNRTAQSLEAIGYRSLVDDGRPGGGGR